MKILNEMVAFYWVGIVEKPDRQTDGYSSTDKHKSTLNWLGRKINLLFSFFNKTSFYFFFFLPLQYLKRMLTSEIMFWVSKKYNKVCFSYKITFQIAVFFTANVVRNQHCFMHAWLCFISFRKLQIINLKQKCYLVSF